MPPGAGPVWPDSALAPGGSGTGSGRPAMSPETAKLLDVGITIAGLIVVTLLSAALAIIEAFYSPLRVFGVRAPVSLVMAVVTNPLLGWFAYITTKRRLAALLPAAAWCVIWVLAAGRTSEGDLIITSNNWVGLLTLLTGPLAFAVGIYISTMRPRVASRPGNTPGAGSSTSSVRAGS